MTTGYITFQAIDPPSKIIVRARIGEGMLVPTADSGWTTVARPKQTGLTSWTGDDPVQLEIPIIFDQFDVGHSVEADITHLYLMMRQPVGPKHEPPIIRVGEFPTDYPGMLWNIFSITRGDEIRRNIDGQRVRAAMTVTLQQNVAADIVLTRAKTPAKSPAKTSKSTSTAAKTSTGTTIYVVKSGDTLSKIAARELGSSTKWPSIQKLNNLRDPSFITVGEKLKIPKS